MPTYNVEVKYDAVATYYNIKTENPLKAIEIAKEKDENNEKEINILFEDRPEITVMNDRDEVIESITPTKYTFERALKNIIEKTKERYIDKPENFNLYLKELGFSDDLLEYFNVVKKITNKCPV